MGSTVKNKATSNVLGKIKNSKSYDHTQYSNDSLYIYIPYEYTAARILVRVVKIYFSAYRTTSLEILLRETGGVQILYGPYKRYENSILSIIDECVGLREFLVHTMRSYDIVCIFDRKMFVASRKTLVLPVEL